MLFLSGAQAFTADNAISIGLLLTAAGLLISFLVFRRNANKDTAQAIEDAVDKRTQAIQERYDLEKRTNKALLKTDQNEEDILRHEQTITRLDGIITRMDEQRNRVMGLEIAKTEGTEVLLARFKNDSDDIAKAHDKFMEAKRNAFYSAQREHD